MWIPLFGLSEKIPPLPPNVRERGVARSRSVERESRFSEYLIGQTKLEIAGSLYTKSH